MFSRALAHSLRGFVQNRSGNSALMFALAAVPFFGILGLATDYGLALADKAKLDGAADAAALAAIRVAQSAIQGGASRTAAMAAGSAQALKTFSANAGSLAFGSAPTPAFNWTRGASGQTLSVTATYSMTMTNAFSRLIGYSTTTVQGTAVTTLTMPTYINYYIITDISQSMGVGATPTDMQALYDRVIKYSNYDTAQNAQAKVGCVFGCHVPQSGGQPDSNENLAHAVGSKYQNEPYITLRIDSAKSAIQSIISDAQTSNTQAGMPLIQIGVYTMQQDPQNAGSYLQDVSTKNPSKSNLTPPLASPTSDFTTLSSNVTNNMDLGANNGGGTGDTGFTNSLTYFVNSVLKSQGDGSSSNSPINYVFLITDGLSDLPGYCTDGHCTGPFDDTLCTPIKAKSTVGVIYTTYNPIYKNNDPSQQYVDTYRDLVATPVAAIPGNLQACSSDSSKYYFEAKDGPGITTAMKALFAPTSQQARISK